MKTLVLIATLILFYIIGAISAIVILIIFLATNFKIIMIIAFFPFIMMGNLAGGPIN